MAKLNKEERKQRIKQWQAAERTKLVASMPMMPQQLNALLDYLDVNLESCDHTTKLTDIFLHVEKLDRNRVLSWLAEQGGHCDCEVLYNLEDLATSFLERPTPPKLKTEKDHLARDLHTITGWNLTNLPQPWRIANLYAPDEPLQIQIGKKGGCTIKIIESAMPPGDQMSNDYWSQLWYMRTELPRKASIRISHGTLDLPKQLRSTVVQTSAWIPVYCWIIPEKQKWYLEVRTELNRQQGDLQQVARLITQLETHKA